jgi:hypothetical protein
LLDERLEQLIDELKKIEDQINSEFEKRQKDLKYKIEQGKIYFETNQIKQFRQLKKNVFIYIAHSSLFSLLVAPFVYLQIFPCLLMDFSVTVYQHICFRVYGIPRVRRNDYIVFDRHHLAYLNLIEKFNCMYCSYFNGVIAYVREVASLSEQYWCPIRHALRKKDLHRRHNQFIPYGEAIHYYEKLENLRNEIRKRTKDENIDFSQ